MDRYERRTARSIASKASALACALALGVVGLVAPLTHASIEGSKHDFRQLGSDSATGSSSREICAFCHTPAGESTPPGAPLWKRHENNDTEGYERLATFGTPYLEETGSAAGSVSLTCLSCHDGTHAPDVSYVGQHPSPGAAELRASIDGDEPNRFRAYLPSNTAANHPVHVPYAGGACTGVERDCDPAAVGGGRRDFRTARFDVINSTKSWWVDAPEGVPGMRDKSDMILYARDFDGTVGPAVECGSCHDPHDARERPVSFMRLSPTDSSLCLTCHVK